MRDDFTTTVEAAAYVARLDAEPPDVPDVEPDEAGPSSYPLSPAPVTATDFILANGDPDDHPF